MSAKDIVKALTGRKIVRVTMNAFRTGRSHAPWSYNPTFYLDDGTAVKFDIDETEIEQYGVTPYVFNCKKAKP